MFWIAGGEEIFHSLDRVVGSPVTHLFHTQLQHVAWEGFRFYDLIFPLFLFIVGAAPSEADLLGEFPPKPLEAGRRHLTGS